MKIIAQIANRMKFTENEISVIQKLAYSAYQINLEMAKKENKKLTFIERKRMKENMFKIISKVSWEYKKAFYEFEEMKEEDFREYTKILLEELFINNCIDRNMN